MQKTTQHIWQDNAADIFKAQSPQRRANDDLRVYNLHNMLSQTPTGWEILKWADQNKVEIWLDYECEDGGYYVPGSNTVCLNAHMRDVDLIPILAHELRHCWQDHQGFIATQFFNSHEYVLNTRFIEADATAFELQVYHELKTLGLPYIEDDRREAFLPQWSDNNPRPDYLKDGMDVLYAGFVGWFTDTYGRNMYDMGSVTRLENLLGIAQSDFQRFGEYIVDNGFEVPDRSGVEQNSETAFRKLGETFDGQNYLADLPCELLKEPLLTQDFSKKTLERLERLERTEQEQRQQGLLNTPVKMPLFKAQKVTP